jgi:hypothetical protein
VTIFGQRHPFLVKDTHFWSWRNPHFVTERNHLEKQMANIVLFQIVKYRV